MLSRRGFFALTTGALGLGLLSSCIPTPQRPSERAVNFGFEDVVTQTSHWAKTAARLHRAHVNAVAISVGRADWTAFPWEKYPEAAPDSVMETGRDYVEEAIDALRPQMSDKGWLTLTIDTLVPALIAGDEGLAGTDPHGLKDSAFPSVTALTSGEVGDRIVEFTDEICRRYKPDRVALTELMFDNSTFGRDDLASYREHSGSDDWPRKSNHTIDTTDPSLGAWRSAAVADLLARVRETAAKYNGVQVEVDVRASQSDPILGCPLSGHNYSTLLTEANRIVVWNYFGINAGTPESGAEIAQALEEKHPGRYAISTGLWAEHGIVSGQELKASLEALAAAGADAVSVTPASKMADEHWDVLEQLWKP